MKKEKKEKLEETPAELQETKTDDAKQNEAAAEQAGFDNEEKGEDISQKECSNGNEKIAAAISNLHDVIDGLTLPESASSKECIGAFNRYKALAKTQAELAEFYVKKALTV